MTEEQITAARRLDRALCNFCNGAGDEFLPSLWREEVKRAFAELCAAYNEAYSAGLFPPPLPLTPEQIQKMEERRAARLNRSES